ncbi:MAG: acyl carrier protein [Clostridiales bacterium]|jgi:acyl carrier protein|nr:acyl carrier protein [Clostridiales bacterium]
MTRAAILEKVNSIFQENFDDDSIVVTEETTAKDVEDWDSLEHINLIVAMEKAFGINFKMGETLSMKNVGEMLDIIQARTKIE